MPRVTLTTGGHRNANVGDTIEVGQDEGLFLTLHGYGHYANDNNDQADNDTDPTKRPDPGANKQAWSEHATTLNIDTTGLTKAEIIQAVDNGEGVGITPQ